MDLVLTRPAWLTVLRNYAMVTDSTAFSASVAGLSLMDSLSQSHLRYWDDFDLFFFPLPELSVMVTTGTKCNGGKNLRDRNFPHRDCRSD